MKLIQTLCFITLGFLMIIGEVSCIVKLIKSDFEPSYRREIIYAAAFVTGAGCIVGYIDIPDNNTNLKTINNVTIHADHSANSNSHGVNK